MIDVLGLGVLSIDDLLYVDAYPAPDEKARVLSRETQCGGLTGTALVAAARLGARCAWAGALNDSDNARYVLKNLQREHIDAEHRVFHPMAAPFHSTIVIDAQRQTRNVFSERNEFHGGSTEGPDEALIKSARVLFVDHVGIPGMIRAAEIARAAGIPVVGDLERDTATRFFELLGLVDHAIVSAKFAQKLSNTSDPRSATRALSLEVLGRRVGGPPLVVATCGEQGCWYFDPASMPAAQQFPAFKVNVVDTTGCGDVFHGAYAAALAQKLPLHERIRIASASAALKAEHRGGQAGIPQKSDIEKFLASAS